MSAWSRQRVTRRLPATQRWGSNTDREWGNGTITHSLVPGGVSEITNSVAISAGMGMACAVLHQGTVPGCGKSSLVLTVTAPTAAAQDCPTGSRFGSTATEQTAVQCSILAPVLASTGSCAEELK